tara:strand:+ start:227 stop:466 length:240 start_codon:yes stop_codon:yes gene_type:complete
MSRRRTSSTIPFGYRLSEEDSAYLEEIPTQLEALEDIKDLLKEKVLSLREGSLWLEHKTGRRLSHAGLKKILDNERLGQ